MQNTGFSPYTLGDFLKVGKDRNITFVNSITEGSKIRMNDDMMGAGKKILVLTDCSHGALDAGRFAVKYLFDEYSGIILLQTFQTPVQGQSVLNTISPMLEKIARRELNELKARLSEDCGISRDKIEARVIEGELEDILVNEFGKYNDLSIVAGAISESAPNKIPCRNIINALMNCNIHPVFLISEGITLFEESRILLITANENKISSQYLNYLRELGSLKGKAFELVTENNKRQIAMTPESCRHFSAVMDCNNERRLSFEKLFYERVLSSSPIPGNTE